MKQTNSKQRSADPNLRKPSNGSNNLWLGMIIGGLSVLVLVLIGFIIYQRFDSQIGTTASNNQAVPPTPTTSNPPLNQNTNSQATTGGENPSIPASPSVQEAAPTSNSTAQTTNTGIQPGQFVQNAFGNKAEIELLKVNRLPGQPDTVNVQFRLRAIRADKGTYEDFIPLSDATATNPSTGETYKPVERNFTSSIPPLQAMYNDNQPSVDAYVWLRIPKEANTVDIQLPKTGVFKNVPISEPSIQPASSTPIQPGQFVNYALKNKAKVELLKVNRIPGERNVVNVQVRIRPVKRGEGTWSDYISMSRTTARDPNTSEAFQAVPQKSTDQEHITSLQEMETKNLLSLDAYVWLSIPEGINTIDIYLPNTQAFTNVPIANQ